VGMTAIRRFPAPWSGALRRAEVGHTVSLRAFSFSSGTFWERQAGAGLRKMLTATNDRRAYIRRRSVEVAVRDGTIDHVTLSQIRIPSRLCKARCGPVCCALPREGQEIPSLPPFIVDKL